MDAALRHLKAPGKAVALQYAALPFRVVDGAAEILLVTTRCSGRWIPPKGWPVEGLPPADCAALAAIEEAGVVGDLVKAPLGSFRFSKKRKGRTLACTATLFALNVTHCLPHWPQKQERKTRWFSAGDAIAAVDVPELRRLLIKFADSAPVRTH